MDNGYWLWSFQGRNLQKQPLERFCQLQWRPRPASLLTTEHIKVKEDYILSHLLHGNESIPDLANTGHGHYISHLFIQRDRYC